MNSFESTGVVYQDGNLLSIQIARSDFLTGWTGHGDFGFRIGDDADGTTKEVKDTKRRCDLLCVAPCGD
jgi:hypothetical protein